MPESIVGDPVSVESAVQRYLAEWMDATAVLSDSSKMVAHPGYKRIVSLGEPAIPAILRSLQQEPSILAWALYDITKVNPVRPADYGKINRITKTWLKWGKKNKYT